MPGERNDNGRRDAAAASQIAEMSATLLALLRGSAIGSTPAFGAGYLGSSPSPGANSSCFVETAVPRVAGTAIIEVNPGKINFRALKFEANRNRSDLRAPRFENNPT
jgi:hypothetical protein